MNVYLSELIFFKMLRVDWALEIRVKGELSRGRLLMRYCINVPIIIKEIRG